MSTIHNKAFKSALELKARTSGFAVKNQGPSIHTGANARSAALADQRRRQTPTPHYVFVVGSGVPARTPAASTGPNYTMIVTRPKR